MSHILVELYERVCPVLDLGDTMECRRLVSERLKTLPDSPFHIALELSISNPLPDVAGYFDRFFRREAGRFRIAAAYTEMNGFDINPGRWYCDAFAYARYGGREDYNWISEWQSESYDEMTITGLEPLQKVYASSAFHDEAFRDAAYAAGLLVVTLFQDLIRRAAPQMRELHFPLLATAHEYDFIFEAKPPI